MTTLPHRNGTDEAPLVTEFDTRLPDLVDSPKVWMVSVSGALLLMTLRAWRRSDGAS